MNSRPLKIILMIIGFQWVFSGIVGLMVGVVFAVKNELLMGLMLLSLAFIIGITGYNLGRLNYRLQAQADRSLVFAGGNFRKLLCRQQDFNGVELDSSCSFGWFQRQSGGKTLLSAVGRSYPCDRAT